MGVEVLGEEGMAVEAEEVAAPFRRREGQEGGKGGDGQGGGEGCAMGMGGFGGGRGGGGGESAGWEGRAQGEVKAEEEEMGVVGGLGMGEERAQLVGERWQGYVELVQRVPAGIRGILMDPLRWLTDGAAPIPCDNAKTSAHNNPILLNSA
ncbi:hypothetical protein CYMTET_52762 [Cymbomonas tetramitiformis]|uniref:Uncharacterized protein n=1 Tax=Cymbomonas tetramitiformis TaxID=36881 RepID=A0AAE0EQR2_9CHLO|nr:hypothetical protein CYMTET_52762 [Cymbomonas tetramitiformis]